MESRLLEILVCPTCKGPLRYERAQQELICQGERLAFPIRDGVPVMLPDEARSLSDATSSGSAKSAAPASAPPAADTAAPTQASQPPAPAGNKTSQAGPDSAAQPTTDAAAQATTGQASKATAKPVDTRSDIPSSDKPTDSQPADRNKQP